MPGALIDALLLVASAGLALAISLGLAHRHRARGDDAKATRPVPYAVSPPAPARWAVHDRELGHLQGELILALYRPYIEAVRCYENLETSVLEFAFRVVANRRRADVVGRRFVGIKRGAPVNPSVIDCVSRALGHPFSFAPRSGQSFPTTFDGEIVMEVKLGS
jgi:hypothetical protein